MAFWTNGEMDCLLSGCFNQFFSWLTEKKGGKKNPKLESNILMLNNEI